MPSSSAGRPSLTLPKPLLNKEPNSPWKHEQVSRLARYRMPDSGLMFGNVQNRYTTKLA